MPEEKSCRVPCSECPWRGKNHGVRHADGWFTTANRKRLWSKLRRGEAMSCHKTDPSNPVPEGGREVPEGTKAQECAGAAILQQREFMRFQVLTKGRNPKESKNAYLAQHPGGMTINGLRVIMEKSMFTLPGERPPLVTNLNEPDIHHDAVVPWDPEVEGNPTLKGDA